METDECRLLAFEAANSVPQAFNSHRAGRHQVRSIFGMKSRKASPHATPISCIDVRSLASFRHPVAHFVDDVTD
ncbi:hypothetical protein [Caballeronia sp. GAWG2-1]|uniref:hypothetical protein n=1 Tax=Caballeronia sp. GAWG2-1 TaxID=2921744 RepID=UPI002027BA45|nr:hypothetical protein [Caballeronia sp. GAWG2-1]